MATLSPPAMEKFAPVNSTDDGLSVIRSTYHLAKGSPINDEAADLICPRGGCGVLFSQRAYLNAFWSCPACGGGARLTSNHWLHV